MSAGEHAGGEVTDEWGGLKVEVSKHGVGAPAADHLDYVWVDASAEERHGAARAERACGDVVGGEAQGGAEARSGAAECFGDGVGVDGAPTDVGKVGVQGGLVVGPVEAEVCDAADEGGDGAGDGVAAATMGHDLATDPIFLVVKGDFGVIGSGEVVERAGEMVDGKGVAEELDTVVPKPSIPKHKAS